MLFPVVTNTVSGDVTRFVYDGDGTRVLREDTGGLTANVGAVEVHISGTERTTTTYYFAGGERILMRRIAMREGDVVTYLHGDHGFRRRKLGSASLATDEGGAQVSEMRYPPFGEIRYGDAPTDRRFTGQREESGIGLFDYGARFYSQSLGRFISADLVALQPQNPQTLNRYAYTLNNPLKYVDSSGNVPIIPLLLLAGFILVAMPSSNINPNEVYVHNLETMPATDADKIISLFATDYMIGNSPQDRMEAILGATRMYPGGYFSGDYGETGFQEQFQDDYMYRQYWGGSSDQVGHFLTAVGFGYRAFGSQNLESQLLALAVGHEMIGDNEFASAFQQYVQGVSHPEAITYFQAAIDADIVGDYESRDAWLQKVLGPGALTNRKGNSMEDLRLTIRGWRLGQMIARGDFTTREEVVAWLETYIKAP